MSKGIKKKRQSELVKIKTAINMMSSWVDVDNIDYSNYSLTSNDMKLLKAWIEERKEEKRKALVKEIETNDEIFRKNTEEHNVQVQVGLYKRGYPREGEMFHKLIERQKLDIKEFEIKLKYGFKFVNPKFEFEKQKEWEEHLMEVTRYKIKETKESLDEIEKNVAEVEEAISNQTNEVQQRREHILVEMKELGMDVSKYEESSDKTYIG